MVFELGNLPNLISTIGQGLQKVVVLVLVKVPITRLGVVKFGGTLKRQFEARFRQIAGFSCWFMVNR